MKRILVVDDSAIAREIVIRVLGDGYDFIKAGSGEEALEKVRESLPDLILLDLLMPGMDGFGVLGSLRESGAKVPVIVLSADIQKTTKAKVLELGAVDIFNKPIDPETFRSCVAKILGNAGGVT